MVVGPASMAMRNFICRVRGRRIHLETVSSIKDGTAVSEVPQLCLFDKGVQTHTIRNSKSCPFSVSVISSPNWVGGGVRLIIDETILISNDFYGGKLTLNIAGNYGVEPEVESHLRSVFRQLRTISDRCHRFRERGGQRYGISYTGLSPNPGGAIENSSTQFANLKESIYQHSVKKFSCRIHKRYKPFMAFMARLGECRGKGASEEDQKTWETLRHAQEIVKNIIEFLSTKFKYDEMVNWLDMLDCEVRECAGRWILLSLRTALKNSQLPHPD